MSAEASRRSIARKTKDRPKSKSKPKDSQRSKKGNPSTGNSRQDEEPKDYSLNLYCAIYTPHFGNYYHWAFAVSNPACHDWHIFEVVQDVQDGPFAPVHRAANPTNSRRCHQPLTFLGQLHSGWWATLVTNIGMIAPGEALSWNCQDYVMEIWDMLLSSGMIDSTTWHWGRQQMMPYYGQDFGGDENEQGDTYEDVEEEESRQAISEEFVYDSSDN